MRVNAQKISRDFIRKSASSNVFCAVQETDIELLPGTVTVISGRSGSGKSTLLNMLSGILTPTSGSVMYDETDIYALGDEERSLFRNRHIGYIPQGTSAIAALSVRENILLPVMFCDGAPDDKSYISRAGELMEQLFISELCDVRPAELSGGELRRMAIARALLLSPDVIFADEPTGDLDDENTRLVFKLLRRCADEGAAVFIITHESDTDGIADKGFRMDAGALYEK